MPLSGEQKLLKHLTHLWPHFGILDPSVNVDGVSLIRHGAFTAKTHTHTRSFIVNKSADKPQHKNVNVVLQHVNKCQNKEFYKQN